MKRLSIHDTTNHIYLSLLCVKITEFTVQYSNILNIPNNK